MLCVETIVAIEVKWKLYTNAPMTRRGWLEWRSLFEMELINSNIPIDYVKQQ